jgi:hypothetical protein
VPGSDGYRESPDGRYVLLPGGLALPYAPCRLALDLESRGCRLWRDGDHLVIEPASALTDRDLDAIREWKHHILVLLDRVTSKEVQ